MHIMAVSVHPDDETLGCGGALLKHHAEGDSLSWLIVTSAYEPQWPAETIKAKAIEVERVRQAYGIQQCVKLDFPSARLDAVPQADLIDRIRAAFRETTPEIVYLVHGGDVHSDHRGVFDATMSVLKPFHMAKLGVRKVLSYETISSTDAAPPGAYQPFIPNIYSDITPYIDRKIEIMALYQSEAQLDPMPRGPCSIRAAARQRGATIGVDYAEAFMLTREII